MSVKEGVDGKKSICVHEITKIRLKITMFHTMVYSDCLTLNLLVVS